MATIPGKWAYCQRSHSVGFGALCHLSQGIGSSHRSWFRRKVGETLHVLSKCSTYSSMRLPILACRIRKEDMAESILVLWIDLPLNLEGVGVLQHFGKRERSVTDKNTQCYSPISHITTAVADSPGSYCDPISTEIRSECSDPEDCSVPGDLRRFYHARYFQPSSVSKSGKENSRGHREHSRDGGEKLPGQGK